MEKTTVAINQTRYFAMSLARSSVVKMVANVSRSSTYVTLRRMCNWYMQWQLNVRFWWKITWMIRYQLQKLYEWQHPTSSPRPIFKQSRQEILLLSSRDNLLSHYAARYLGTNCSVCLHTGAYGLHPHSARRRSWLIKQTNKTENQSSVVAILKDDCCRCPLLIVCIPVLFVFIAFIQIQQEGQVQELI